VFFKKLFGKKNDGFFLQLEDEDATSKPETKAKAQESAQPVAAPVAAPVAVQPVATPAAVTTEVAPSGVAATAAPATGTVAPLDKKAAKAEEKAAEKAAKAAKRAAGKTETPKVVAASAPAAPAITNFATDYLIKPSSISGRRMPGANMKGFLDLARQVEKPKAFKAAASERKAEK
jgi:hypothetical protein